jgi:hypothetical protein
MEKIKPLICFCIFVFLVKAALFSSALDIPELEKLAVQYQDSRMFYNLGVSYANTNNVGRAVLNLKRAYLLNNNDKTAFNILNDLRSSIGVPPYWFEVSPLEKAALLPFTFFSLNGGFLLGFLFLLWGSFGLSVVLSRILPVNFQKHKDIILKTSIFLFIFGILYLFFSILRYQSTFDKKNAVVIKNEALFETPGGKARKLKDLPAGMECAIREESSGFYLIRTIQGQEGWVEKNGVEKLWNGFEGD